MVPGSAIHHKGRAGSLAVIKERDEVVRSADPNMSKSRVMAAAAAAQQINALNQQAGYNAAAPALNQNQHQVRQLRRDAHTSNHDIVILHRSPLIPAGKENKLQLPPIESPRVAG